MRAGKAPARPSPPLNPLHAMRDALTDALKHALNAYRKERGLTQARGSLDLPRAGSEREHRGALRSELERGLATRRSDRDTGSSGGCEKGAPRAGRARAGSAELPPPTPPWPIARDSHLLPARAAASPCGALPLHRSGSWAQLKRNTWRGASGRPGDLLCFSAHPTSCCPLEAHVVASRPARSRRLHEPGRSLRPILRPPVSV